METEKLVEITEEDFEAYEDVRLSGVTNMFDIRTVSNLSGLTKDQIKEIMRDYGKYQKEFKSDE